MDEQKIGTAPTINGSANESCGGCKFFLMDAKNMKQGVCRRNPPDTFVLINEMGCIPVSDFPSVKLSGWCGEFKRKLEFTA